LSSRKIAFLYCSICLIWGSTWLAIKIGLNGLPPFLGAGLRFTISAAVIFGFVLVRKTNIRLCKDDKISILSCGFLSFASSYAGVYWAEQHISSGLTAILFCTMPLMVSLLSRFWTRSETLTGRKLAGILVGMAGTAILFWPDEKLSGLKALAMLAALGASLAAAINLVMMKKYSRHTDIYVLNALGMTIGAACLLTLSLMAESHAQVSWSWDNIMALLYLSLFGTVAAFLVYYRLIKEMDATALSLVTLICPLIALGLGWVFLKERMTAGAGMGIAIVLLGVAIASRAARTRPPALQPPGQP
jgi:drug/metabolite transporter (DMT)-like permease